jgi:hypothetical protein
MILPKSAKFNNKAITLAVLAAFGLFGSLAVDATSTASNTVSALQADIQSYSIRGPLIVGPVESVHSQGKFVTVLGTRIDTRHLEGAGMLLPAQYVAVFGALTQDGEFQARSIQVLSRSLRPG